MRIGLAICLLWCGNFYSQQLTCYTLSNDSIELNTEQNKLILIYYTNRSCFDCFISIHHYLKTDTANHYFYIIEKAPSAIANYNTFTMLAAKGIPKEKLLFTKTHHSEISPFLKIYNTPNVTYIPYKDIFIDKEILQFSDLFKEAIKHP